MASNARKLQLRQQESRAATPEARRKASRELESIRQTERQQAARARNGDR